MSDLDIAKQSGLDEVAKAADLRTLEELRVKYLGKKGLITSEMSKIGSLPPEEKKTYGAKVNEAKLAVESVLDAKKAVLEEAEINRRLESEKIDVTLPVRAAQKGSIHPISKVMDEIAAILNALGFGQKDGPNIEDDYHNFTALNIPETHPARQMHDTFYLPPAHDGKLQVLRTHTSPVQIRTMEQGKPPFRIFSMGRTYRSDSDMTHTPMFHQVEALYVDKNVNMANLKWMINEFITSFFGERKVRLRPSYFPFTEPSAEVDIEWENGKWLEIMGAGMVHPTVLKNVGIDPNEYSGFAFGAGIERMAMLKYNIPDLRQFFESDLRWLRHYAF